MRTGVWYLLLLLIISTLTDLSITTGQWRYDGDRKACCTGMVVTAFTIPSRVSSSATRIILQTSKNNRPFFFDKKKHNGRHSNSILPFTPSKQTKLSMMPAAVAPTTTVGAMTSMAMSFIKSTQIRLHSDSSFVLTAILLLSAFGVSLERRTVIGKALSAPLATMALALVVANIGIVPFSSPVYSMVNSFLVPLAIPMLLFDSNLKRIVSDTGSLLAAFGIGTISTIVGTLIAYPLIPLKSLGSSGWKIACALAARHIGGAINFVAVAETLGVDGTSISAAIAADNLVVALYFAFLFYLGGKIKKTETINDDSTTKEAQEIIDSDPENVGSNNQKSDISLSTIGLSLAISSSIVTASRGLTQLCLPPGTSALPIMSLVTVAAASFFPKFFSRLCSTGSALGIVLIQMFFAASGACGNLRLVLQRAPALFGFSMLQIALHFATLVGLGRGLLKLSSRELYLASNANVGGPTTAAAMAQALQWNRLVLPALLIGILGYAVGTAIALGLAPILLKLSTL